MSRAAVYAAEMQNNPNIILYEWFPEDQNSLFFILCQFVDNAIPISWSFVVEKTCNFHPILGFAFQYSCQEMIGRIG